LHDRITPNQIQIAIRQSKECPSRGWGLHRKKVQRPQLPLKWVEHHGNFLPANQVPTQRRQGIDVVMGQGIWRAQKVDQQIEGSCTFRQQMRQIGRLCWRQGMKDLKEFSYHYSVPFIEKGTCSLPQGNIIIKLATPHRAHTRSSQSGRRQQTSSGVHRMARPSVRIAAE